MIHHTSTQIIQDTSTTMRVAGLLCYLLALQSVEAHRRRARCFSGEDFSFEHGVASGDVEQDSVVLWTRVTPSAEVEADDRKRVLLRYAVCKAEDGKPPAQMFPQKSWSFLKRLLHRKNCRLGWVATGAHRDYTVKVAPSRLGCNRNYYYQFQLAFTDKVSPIGRTITLPSQMQEVAQLNYGVVSCSSYPHGYFHVYETLANAENLDFWLHVGDYQYEYGSYAYPGAEGYAREEPFRPIPEAVTLEEYRARYAQYKTDAALQKLHRRAPVFAIWDDHEVANDARSDGAQNHQPTCSTAQASPFPDLGLNSLCDKDEHDYQDRVDAATRAYFEWMPVREEGMLDDPIARRSRSFEFHFGNLASFAGYDTRLSQRTHSDPTDLFQTDNALAYFALVNTNVTAWYEEPLASTLAAYAAAVQNDLDVTAEVMGQEKRDSMSFLFAESMENGAPWQVLATPIPMGKRSFADFVKAGNTLSATLQAYGADVATATALTGGFQAVAAGGFASDVGFRLAQASGMTNTPWNSDTWDGFETEREKVLQIFQQSTNNAVVVAGDSHNAFAQQLSTAEGVPVAVEYDTAAVTSTGLEERAAPFAQFLQASGYDAVEHSVLAANSHIKYANIKDRGFMMFEVTRTHHVGEYVFMNADRYQTTISNAGPLKNSNYSAGVHYCDAKMTATAGTPGVFSTAEAPEFFVPVQCNTKFAAEHFDALF